MQDICMVLNEKWFDKETGKYKCPECGKLYSKKGICSHYIINHTEKGKIQHQKTLQKRHHQQTGKPAWNSGLTKETDNRIKKYGKTFSEKYKRGEIPPSGAVLLARNNKELHLLNARKGGLKSVHLQGRRSKNEKLFCEMCESFFQNVKHNEPIFNGWDADVIIEDIKVAVLWNGIWHYKKITESHSVEQVKNRDSIKLKEIESAGYKHYIIKDMGKYNPDFVKEEFDKFIQNCLKT